MRLRLRLGVLGGEWLLSSRADRRAPHERQAKCDVAAGSCVSVSRSDRLRCHATNLQHESSMRAVRDGGRLRDGGTPFCKDSACVQCMSDKDCPGKDAKCESGQCK